MRAQTLQATTLRLGNAENLGHCLQPAGTPTRRSRSVPACDNQLIKLDSSLRRQATLNVWYSTLTVTACRLADASSLLSAGRLRDIREIMSPKCLRYDRLTGDSHHASAITQNIKGVVRSEGHGTQIRPGYWSCSPIPSGPGALSALVCVSVNT